MTCLSGRDDIFHASRNLAGEQRPLPDAPGHLFSIEDGITTWA
jgi:hypothetical protein